MDSMDGITSKSVFPLNLQTKYWIYEKTNRAICYFFKGDREAKNHVQIPKHLSFENSESINLEEKSDKVLVLELTKDEQTQQENCVYLTTMLLSLYFSLVFNYVYSVFLQEVIVSSSSPLYDLISDPCFAYRLTRVKA